MDTLFERLDACKTLPTMPGIALELLRLCRNEDADARVIAETLSRDPALAAKVLKTANSSIYRRRAEVKTVQQAVSMLGASTIATLALSFSLVVNRGAAGFDHSAFWAQSLFSAVAARSLARRVKLDPDQLFLAGLIQDIGVLGLATVLPEYAPLVVAANGDHQALAAAERGMLGIDHGEVTAWLARRWNLPEYIADAAHASHAHSQGAGATLASRCVATSGWIASIWTGESAALATRDAALRASAWLEMDRAMFHDVLADIVKEVPELGRLLDIGIEDSEELEQIANHARTAMAAISFKSHDAGRLPTDEGSS